MTEKLPDVWITRDYPVLVAAARRLDAGEGVITGEKLVADTGLSLDEVRNATAALERRGYLSRRLNMGGGVRVDGISGAAYLVTGLHPDGDDLAERLISVLTQAADATGDEEERGALKRSARALGNVSGNVLAGVLTAWISQQTGIAP